MAIVKDLTGQRFGRLFCKSQAGKTSVETFYGSVFVIVGIPALLQVHLLNVAEQNLVGV